MVHLQCYSGARLVAEARGAHQSGEKRRCSSSNALRSAAAPRLDYSTASSDEGFRATEAGASPPPAKKPLLDVRVLVVEDDADSRELMATILEHWGCVVVGVESVAEAFAALDVEQPEIILSDIGMPREDGYAFLRRLRSFDQAGGGNLPVVAVTAFSNEADKRRAAEAGFDELVPKPVHLDVLFRTMVRLLQR